MVSDSKIHIGGVSAIVITVVGSIFLFGLSDNVFPFNINTAGSSTFENSAVYSENMPTEDQETFVPEPVTETNVPVEKIEDTKKSTASSETPPESITKTTSEPQKSNHKDDLAKTQKQSVEDKKRELEKAKFILSGSGSAYEGAPQLSKPASFKIELFPVLGSDLTSFSIIDGNLVMGTTSVNLDDGLVTIFGNDVTVSISHDTHLDPYLNMSGKIRGSVLNEDGATVSFSKQTLSLIEDDLTPYYLDLTGKLEH